MTRDHSSRADKERLISAVTMDEDFWIPVGAGLDRS